MNEQLNFPSYEFRLEKVGHRVFIFDEVRKKKIVLTPEEWVRQHLVRYLIEALGVPESLLGIEVKVNVNNQAQRADILVYDRSGSPLAIVECKAPEVKISSDVFFQIARYNSNLKAKYLIVSNGKQHFCCINDYQKGSCTMLEAIPLYKDMLTT